MFKTLAAAALIGAATISSAQAVPAAVSFDTGALTFNTTVAGGLVGGFDGGTVQFEFTIDPMTFAFASARTTFDGATTFDGNTPSVGFWEFEDNLVIPSGVPPELAHLVGNTYDIVSYASETFLKLGTPDESVVTSYLSQVFVQGTFGPAGPSMMPDPSLSIAMLLSIEEYGLDVNGFPDTRNVISAGYAIASDVPLPGALGLLAIGLGGLGALSRRRTR